MGLSTRIIPVLLLGIPVSFSICMGQTRGDAKAKHITDVFFNPSVGSEQIRTAVLLPIHSEGGDLKHASRTRELVEQAFRTVQKYDFLPAKDLKNLIEERRINRARVHHYTHTLAIGRALSVDGVLMGSLAQYGVMGKKAKFGLNLRMIRIPEGDTVWSASCSATGKASEIEKIANEGIGSMIQKLVEHWQSSQETVAWGIKLPPLQVFGEYKYITVTIPHCPEAEVKSYLVSRSSTESGPFKEIKKLATQRKGSLSFNDGDVSADRLYFYRYRVLTKMGFVSPFSEAIEARLGAAPTAPTGLLATVDKVREIRLSWEKSPDSDVAGYRIYRSKEPDRDGVLIARVKSRMTTRYVDKGDAENPLEYAAKYYYRIATYWPSGKESPKSKAVSALTKGGPSVPKSLKAESDLIREVPLSWAANPDPEVKGYVVYRSRSKDGPYSIIGKVEGRSKTSYVDSEGLADKTDYFYRIVAFNVAGVESDPTAAVSATTRGMPLPPKKLRAKGDMVKSVLLEWTPPSDPEVTGYVVYRGSSPESEFVEVKNIKGKEKNSFLDNGSLKEKLKDGALFYYKLRSYNKVDVLSVETETVSARTKRLPQVPTGLKAVGGQARQIPLSWKANPERDIKRYLIYRADDLTEGYKKIGAEPRGKTEFLDTKVSDGKTYSYKIQAVDEDGLESGFSEVISATTKPTPSSPKGIKAEAGTSRIVVSWSANPEADIVRYNIYRKIVGYKKIDSTKGLSYTDEKVKKGKTYTYKITAVDKDDLESEFSSEVSATIPQE